MRSEGYGTWFVSVYVCVCLSVRLLPRFQRLRATTQRNSDTNGFIAKLAAFKKRRFSYNYCVQKLWRKKQAKRPIANEYSLTAALLQRPLARCFDDRGF